MSEGGRIKRRKCENVQQCCKISLRCRLISLPETRAEDRFDSALDLRFSGSGESEGGGRVRVSLSR